MQTAHVLMIETAPSANEYFVQGPLAIVLHRILPRFSGGDAGGGRAPALFLGVGARRFADPGTRGMRIAPRRQPLRIARAVALQHLIEFAPVDRPVIVSLLRLIPAEKRIRNRK